MTRNTDRATTVAFFKEHGTLAIAPGETEDHARERYATLLAGAEEKMAANGWHVEWEIDPDADNEPGEGYYVSGNPQWEALLYDADGNVIASLCGIDFAEDYAALGCTPARQHPYARVVEAELALEELPVAREGE